MHWYLEFNMTEEKQNKQYHAIFPPRCLTRTQYIRIQPENDPSGRSNRDKKNSKEKLKMWYQGRNGAGLGLFAESARRKIYQVEPGDTKGEDG